MKLKNTELAVCPICLATSHIFIGETRAKEQGWYDAGEITCPKCHFTFFYEKFLNPKGEIRYSTQKRKINKRRKKK